MANLKEKLQAVRLIYAKVKSRYERGRSQFGFMVDIIQVSVVAGYGIELWNKNFSFQIPLEYLPAGMVILVIFFGIWGHLDQTKLHIQQVENDYSASLTPIGKIEKNIQEIKDKLNG